MFNIYYQIPTEKGPENIVIVGNIPTIEQARHRFADVIATENAIVEEYGHTWSAWYRIGRA